MRRLTSHPDPDWHFYFTENGWYDDGRRLLFRSERDGSRQVYSIDVETGLITQVTDLPDCTEGPLDDGEYVGYHGARGDHDEIERYDEMESFLGSVRYDDTDREEIPIPVRATHTNANTRDLFVCDGSPTVQWILLYLADIPEFETLPTYGD